MSRFSRRVGAGASAFGLAFGLMFGLAPTGPGTTAMAFADSPDEGASVGPATSSAAADPRGAATRSAESRTATPSRQPRSERAPRAAATTGVRADRAAAAESIAESIAAEAADGGSDPVATFTIGSDRTTIEPDSDPNPLPEVAELGIAFEATTAPEVTAGVTRQLLTPAAPPASARPIRVPPPPFAVTSYVAAQGFGQFLDGVIGWLSTLPANPVSNFVAGALQLVRRSLPDAPTSDPTQIVIPELDSLTSQWAIRVDKDQTSADAITASASTKPFTLTLPGPASSYTVLANKPALVDVVAAGNHLLITPKTPGFLGLSIKSNDGTAARYLGLYITNAAGIVPDMSTVNGKPPVGTVARTDGTGDKFLEDFNFRSGVAPIDYLYIYDQGGADYTDGNVTGLLTQAVRHGMVPVVVYYNIQAVLKDSQKTYITEGPDPAYQAINEYNVSGQTFPDLFTGYMTRYFKKLGSAFTAMNQVGVPVQIVMEPDFLGYMATAKPSFQGSATPTPVPNDSDRTLNYANVMKPMTDAGLLTAADPTFDNTVAGMVKGINYYVGKNLPNLRIGWKTNIWAVASTDFQNGLMGVIHETDSVTYPWQNQYSGGVGWDKGRENITKAATNLGTFLEKVGVTDWKVGSPDRTPFLAIDKYGVDGAYFYDPQWDNEASNTNAQVNAKAYINAAQYLCNNGAKCDDPTITKYFGVNAATLKTLQISATDPQFRTAVTALQAAAKADPNIAQWFFNADQWNNYLLLVKTLSTTVDAPVMLWQIPQGHINGSTTLTGRDLSNTSNALGCPSGTPCGFEDSATSYFFGDTFTPTGPDAAGRFAHFEADLAKDAKVTTSGDTIIWGEHMTEAGQSGVMSVLFGAGLGSSTRGSPTPAGDVTDLKFWSDKATAYLTTAARG